LGAWWRLRLRSRLDHFPVRHGKAEYLAAKLATRLFARQAGIDLIALPATRTIHDDRHRCLAVLDLGQENENARTTVIRPITWVDSTHERGK
jgi:hypothetical protein